MCHIPLSYGDRVGVAVVVMVGADWLIVFEAARMVDVVGEGDEGERVSSEDEGSEVGSSEELVLDVCAEVEVQGVDVMYTEGSSDGPVVPAAVGAVDGLAFGGVDEDGRDGITSVVMDVDGVMVTMTVVGFSDSVSSLVDTCVSVTGGNVVADSVTVWVAVGTLLEPPSTATTEYVATLRAILAGLEIAGVKGRARVTSVTE